MALSGIRKMPVTAYPEQYRRRIIHDYWEPRGLDGPTYRDMQRELRSMPTLGGPNDDLGVNPARYQKVGSLEEDI
jgi:hypothetical protein